MYQDRKMKIESKRYFQVSYSFIRPFSKYFQVLAQCGVLVNPRLAKKEPKLVVPDRKMKMKCKINFEVRHLLIKLSGIKSYYMCMNRTFYWDQEMYYNP